jgi:membrane-associated phospholipid phosphatase
MKRRSRRSSRLRLAVRVGAYATIGAAVAVPVLRRRLRIPTPVTVVACYSAPLALAVLHPRSKKRDVAIFTAQMLAFTVVHELPYDDPEKLRARLRSRYPIAVDRAIGGGSLPNARLQRLLGRLPAPAKAGADRFLAWTHWLWFAEPYLALALILARDDSKFPRAARQMAAVFDLGCAVYFAAPTAPPWWSAEQGLTEGEEIKRVMVEVGERTWGPAWPRMYETLGGNPWAAMPSLHFATSVSAALSLSEAGKVEGALGWTYALTLGFGLVYLGEHYVTDLLAGGLLVAAVRRGEPLAEPLVEGFNGVLRQLERIASG